MTKRYTNLCILYTLQDKVDSDDIKADRQTVVMN